MDLAGWQCDLSSDMDFGLGDLANWSGQTCKCQLGKLAEQMLIHVLVSWMSGIFIPRSKHNLFGMLEKKRWPSRTSIKLEFIS
jgi:hypothetical protein